MPANLTPEYKAAEAAFKRAREPRERLEHLRTMLRVLPKHKGTDHLAADIKTRIKELTEELSEPKKGGPKRGGPPTFIHPEGAAQVAMVGPPNTGKSTLHDRLTGSHAQIGPYPFTTQYPQPGMMAVEDASLQLIDLPPLAREHPVPWIGNALQAADGCMLVVDLSEAGCLERVLAARDLLEERKVLLTAGWPGDTSAPRLPVDDPFANHLPTLLIVNKTDRLEKPGEEIAVFEDLTDLHFPTLAVSAETGEGLDRIGPWLFKRLGVVRVYTKVPGKPPDMGRPYTIRKGQTVLDVATLVHRDLAASFKYARLWGHGNFDGQQIGADHVMNDGDVVELHA